MSVVGLGRVKTLSRNERGEYPSLTWQPGGLSQRKIPASSGSEKCPTENIVLRLLGKPEFSHSQGHQRRFRDVRDRSACPPIAAISGGAAKRREVPIADIRDDGAHRHADVIQTAVTDIRSRSRLLIW